MARLVSKVVLPSLLPLHLLIVPAPPLFVSGTPETGCGRMGGGAEARLGFSAVMIPPSFGLVPFDSFLLPVTTCKMRLSFIFLAVLAASVLMTALAAWGITFGTSYSPPGFVFFGVAMQVSNFNESALDWDKLWWPFLFRSFAILTRSEFLVRFF